MIEPKYSPLHRLGHIHGTRPRATYVPIIESCMQRSKLAEVRQTYPCQTSKHHLQHVHGSMDAHVRTAMAVFDDVA